MYFAELAIMATPNACTLDVTPPVFAGIATLVANPNGSLTAGWVAATDAGSPPVRYRVFVQKNTATGLFASGNQLPDTYETSQVIFAKKDGTVLDSGVWFVGVRAVDQTGNISGNTQSLSAVSVGVIDGSVLTLAQAVNAALGVGVCAVGGVLEDDPEAPIGVVDDSAVIGIVEDC